MQVRIHRDQELHRGRQQARIAARGDGFAGTEAVVLAHVGQVGRDQPDLLRPEFTGGVGGEHQRQRLVVGPVEVGDEQDALPRDGGAQPHDDLAVGEAVRLHRARGAMQVLRQGFGKALGGRQGQDDGVHASSLTCTVSDWTEAYSSA